MLSYKYHKLLAARTGDAHDRLHTALPIHICFDSYEHSQFAHSILLYIFISFIFFAFALVHFMWRDGFFSARCVVHGLGQRTHAHETSIGCHERYLSIDMDLILLLASQILLQRILSLASKVIPWARTVAHIQFGSNIKSVAERNRRHAWKLRIIFASFHVPKINWSPSASISTIANAIHFA